MNNKINKISPLPNMLLTIGLLPSSYIVSMTYEEQLLWLCNFLKTEVVPKTNANIEAVNQLITYIDNYFDNLDVTEEINNKIDEMVQSGELQELLSEQYEELRNEVNQEYDELRNDVSNSINNISNDVEENTNDINILNQNYENINTNLLNEIERATEKENSLETKINGIIDSNPIPVSSVSDMTNQSRIYVNTTDGKWYYYNTSSSEWTVGGTYQATSIGEGSIEYTMFSNDLKEKVSISIPTYTLIENGYIHQRLTISSNNAFDTTSAIHLNQNDVIKFTANLGTSSEIGLNSGLARCDENGNPVQVLFLPSQRVAGNNTYTYKAPFEMYVRASFKKANGISNVVIYNGSKNNSTPYQSLGIDLQNELDLDITIPNFNVVTGHYISNNLTYAEAVNFAYSTPILLRKGEKIVLKSNTATTSSEQNLVIPLAETDENGTLLNKLLKSKQYSNSNYYEYTAIKDMYVAFSFRLFYEYIYICKNPNFYNFENAGLFTMFTKCACIGDSLTRGHFTNYEEGSRNRDFGYPFVLSRMTRLTVGNYGHSGGTASSIYTQDIENGDFSTFDIALILIGRNGGLSTTEEQDAYSNIITKLKTDNANMQIFCLSLPYSTSGDEIEINERIQNLATSNFVNYIDIFNAPEIQNRDYRADDNVHYNVLGYVALANTIYNQVNKFIVNNYNLYKNMYIPKTLPNTIDDIIN